ncbi:unnamed protein product [Clavelina lepadiformis]|uniref:Uncharacterized protein n=1 Tax=Clavelina lepadiformis TaxID=159417 RepID=A0ABP0GN36_CLALP
MDSVGTIVGFSVGVVVVNVAVVIVIVVCCRRRRRRRRSGAEKKTKTLSEDYVNPRYLNTDFPKTNSDEVYAEIPAAQLQQNMDPKILYEMTTDAGYLDLNDVKMAKNPGRQAPNAPAPSPIEVNETEDGYLDPVQLSREKPPPLPGKHPSFVNKAPRVPTISAVVVNETEDGYLDPAELSPVVSSMTSNRSSLAKPKSNVPETWQINMQETEDGYLEPGLMSTEKTEQTPINENFLPKGENYNQLEKEISSLDKAATADDENLSTPVFQGNIDQPHCRENIKETLINNKAPNAPAPSPIEVNETEDGYLDPVQLSREKPPPLPGKHPSFVNKAPRVPTISAVVVNETEDGYLDPAELSPVISSMTSNRSSLAKPGSNVPETSPINMQETEDEYLEPGLMSTAATADDENLSTPVFQVGSSEATISA